MTDVKKKKTDCNRLFLTGDKKNLQTFKVYSTHISEVSREKKVLMMLHSVRLPILKS
jgi:hypothetical protein